MLTVRPSASMIPSGGRVFQASRVKSGKSSVRLRWRGPSAGTLLLETVFDAGAHVIAGLDDELIDAAISRWIRRFADKPLSLADAVSFEVMRRERISRALTFDRHFADAGFEILNRGARRP